ncbi:hypothetical protein niasHT_037761 [Heterodera trifolii]|uniref:BZIP domain-containing protein n=1 Tax=Heterodera trifolii TaxID=157864 RepID=A0ABD2J7R6_9BILA
MFGQHLHNTVITHGKENAVTYGVTTVVPGDILCTSGRRSIAVADSKRSSTSPTTESEASTPAAVHSQNYVEENAHQQQQQQQIQQQQQHHLDGLNRTDKGPMDDDCWAEMNAMGGTGAAVPTTVVRDAFLGGGFVPHTSAASPPSTTLNTSEFYETNSSATNPILEDAFLSMNPSSLLDVRCGPFTTTAPSVDAAPLHHFRDAGSVGISPCSSSTQISSISSSDDSTIHSLQQQQLFHSHYAFQQHPSSSTAFASGIFHPSFYPLGHSLATIQQPHDDIGLNNGLITFDKLEGHGHLQLHPQQLEGMAHHAGQDEADKETRDVKPPLFIMPEMDPKQQNHGEQQQHQLFADEMEESSADFVGALSPPPPPLTPPSKTRSKMHDLALKYRLITSQNVRGHGSINLSAEEKRTLIQEGFPIPTKLPLLREEEEALKIVRRKIKNKLSAQESRRKRKEYMDMLEKRVHAYFADNTQLRQKVRQLEAQNRFLATQLQRVQQQNGEGTEQQQQH